MELTITSGFKFLVSFDGGDFWVEFTVKIAIPSNRWIRLQAVESFAGADRTPRILSLFSDYYAEFEQGQAVEARYLGLNSQILTVFIKQHG